MFLNKQEIEKGCTDLYHAIDLIVDNQDAEIVADHLNDLSSIGASAFLLYASSKVLYLKNKKEADIVGLYAYSESLMKALHYKMSSLQSLLKKESQTQFNSRLQ